MFSILDTIWGGLLSLFSCPILTLKPQRLFCPIPSCPILSGCFHSHHLCKLPSAAAAPVGSSTTLVASHIHPWSIVVLL